MGERMQTGRRNHNPPPGVTMSRFPVDPAKIAGMIAKPVSFRPATRIPLETVQAVKAKSGEEAKLQRDVEAYLGHNGVTWMFHERNSRGNKAGTPDLLFAYAGRPCAIELKTEDGRLSDAQDRTHDAMRLGGWQVSVCRSIEEVKAFLAVVRNKEDGR